MRPETSSEIANLTSSVALRRMFSRSSSVWSLVFLVGLLVIWPVVLLQTIRNGSHYKSIVVEIDGVDVSLSGQLAVKTQSWIGSQGQLQPCGIPGVFASAYSSQPISELRLVVPENFTAQQLQVSVSYGVRLPVEDDWQSGLVGQRVELVPVEAKGTEFLLRVKPLSGFGLSPWRRALNWAGDVSLVMRTLARAGALSLGLLLLILGGRAFLMDVQSVRRVALSSAESQPRERALADSRRSLLVWCGLMLSVAAILFFRDPRVVLQPSMEVEDGTMIFQHFYLHRHFSELLRFKAGYVPLIPNMLGYLSVRVPTAWAAHWLSVIPFIVTVFFYSLPYARAYARLFPGRGSAVVTCLLLAFAPISDRLLVANTDYMIWNLLGLLLVLSLVDPGNGLVGSSLCLAGLPLLACSHPLGILAGPVLVFRWYLEGRLRSYWIVTLGVMILYQLLGVQHGQVRQADSLVEKMQQIREVALLSFQFSGQLGVRSLLGRVWTESLSPGALQQLSWGMVIVVSGLLVRVLVKQTRLWKEMLLGVYFVCGLTFLCLYARGADSMTDFDGAPRYIYVQSLVFLVLCTSATAFLLASRRSGFDLKVPESRQWLRAAAIAIVILAWNWHLNAELGCFGGMVGKHTPYLVRNAENGPTIARFLQELAHQESSATSAAGFRIEAVKQDDWTITIDTRVVQKESRE